MLFDPLALRSGLVLPNRIALAPLTILNPDWPRDEQVTRPPITRVQLAKRAVSPVFAQYLTMWKNFVAD